MHEFDHDGFPGPGPGGPGHYGFEHHGFPGNAGMGMGIGGWPGMLLSAANTLFWIALCIFLAWILLKWILPYLLSTLTPNPEHATVRPSVSALEILRQRYAVGEIDGVTFEQMRERLEASYSEREQWPPS